MSELHFTKMHGAGNDFIVLDGVRDALPPAETLPDATVPESASTTTMPTDVADPTPPVVPGSDGTPGQH